MSFCFFMLRPLAIKCRCQGKIKELTIKQRRMHPVAPGNKAYQKFKWCNLAPSMNRRGKLAAAFDCTTCILAPNCGFLRELAGNNERTSVSCQGFWALPGG